MISQASPKKIQAIQPEAINFSNVPTTKPKNDPKADLKAFFVSELPLISPRKAPANGPMIIPNGGKKNKPTTKPMVLPQTPLLVPPNFLVP